MAKRKRGEKRKKFQRLSDRRQIIVLYVQGFTQDEIARQIKCSQQQVSADLKAIVKMWQKDNLIELSEMKAIEIAKINELERVFWSAWVKSLGQMPTRSEIKRGVFPIGVLRTVTHVYKPHPDGGGTTMIKISTTDTGVPTVGNLACLAGVERCIAARIKLLGLDAPQLLQIVDDDFDQEKWYKETTERLMGAAKIVDSTVLYTDDPNKA